MRGIHINMCFGLQINQLGIMYRVGISMCMLMGSNFGLLGNSMAGNHNCKILDLVKLEICML